MKSFQFKRTQRKYKTAYRISNWPTYEGGASRQRGSVTVWLSEDAPERPGATQASENPGGRARLL